MKLNKEALIKLINEAIEKRNTEKEETARKIIRKSIEEIMENNNSTLQEKVAIRNSKKPYLMYYSQNNMRSFAGGDNPEELIKHANEREIHNFQIFKNQKGFHSTAQKEFLVAWEDAEGNLHWSN